jgi:hypothetical protein
MKRPRELVNKQVESHIICLSYVSLLISCYMPRKKIKSSPRKKGRRGWTTEEQAVYLESHKTSYLTAQSTKKTSEFWPLVWEEWFQRWPLELSAKDVEDEKTLEDLQRETKAVRLFSRTIVHIPQFTHIQFISILVNGLIITHALHRLARDDVNCCAWGRLKNSRTGRRTLIFTGRLN